MRVTMYSRKRRSVGERVSNNDGENDVVMSRRMASLILLTVVLLSSVSYSSSFVATTTTAKSRQLPVSESPTAISMVLAHPGRANNTLFAYPNKAMRSYTSNKRKYQRKIIPDTELKLKSLRKQRQAEFEQALRKAAGKVNIWTLDSLFPEPVWDEDSIQKDLYAVKERDEKTRQESMVQSVKASTATAVAPVAKRIVSNLYGSPPQLSVVGRVKTKSKANTDTTTTKANAVKESRDTIGDNASQSLAQVLAMASATALNSTTAKVDRDMSRMVRDRIFGYRRTPAGTFEYDTSLMGDGAIQFRDGVRLGNPLKVNADRLAWLAKKELQHGRVEEAQELYSQALTIDPRDGRAYLGLSRCAQRRNDYTLARSWLQAGITHSRSIPENGTDLDRGANPFLLQALGCLEEKMGHLSEAEKLYIAAARSRPSHAAAWVALAQLRTRKLGQGARAGRLCYIAAEREAKRAGIMVPAHVYTAWAWLEYNMAGDTQRARLLYKKALKKDTKCSAALLSLGVLEAKNEQWDEAQACFDKVLKFDQRNSRVLQAYALMESKRPTGSSRKAIDLFERALKANPRDAGVLQAYALYVDELGDIDSARDLLRRGTEIDKRYAPVWQAWGVLEYRNGNTAVARSIFQEGIWACAQLTGGQSGGYSCARLWQAWGVLEAGEGDYAAARRCFSRALDADTRNVASVTAWAQMEAKLGNVKDARHIFERALSRYSAGCDEKAAIWRSYELMEKSVGNTSSAQQVYQRSMRETFLVPEEIAIEEKSVVVSMAVAEETTTSKRRRNNSSNNSKSSEEVEVVRWGGEGSLPGEIWYNENSIESKVPYDMKKSMRDRSNNNKRP